MENARGPAQGVAIDDSTAAAGDALPCAEWTRHENIAAGEVAQLLLRESERDSRLLMDSIRPGRALDGEQ